jgi:hypothetical protein
VRATSIAILAAESVMHAQPSKTEVLKRAAEYVQAQAQLLPQLVAEERSTQTFRPRVRGEGDQVVRDTHSDFAWVRLEGMAEALGVRDVLEVDGKPVGDGGRLDRLLRMPVRGRLPLVQHILDESASYNLAPGSRNMNIPTFALFLLLPELQPRFSWKSEEANGPGSFVLAFKERDRPTYIRGPRNEPVFSRGRVWIEPATGTVQRTELRARVQDPRDEYWTTYVLVVEFTIDPALHLMVPRRLRERYETRVSIVTGAAEYVNYRRFQTEGRLVR